MSSLAPGRVVELNIGGSLFTTTVGTLLNGKNQERISGGAGFNFFAKLFAKESSDSSEAKEEVASAGDCEVLRDSHGRLFIDREGKFFAPVLQYLRTGVLCVPSDMCIDGLLREASFYGVPLPLSSAMRSGDLTPSDECTAAPLIINNKHLMREANCAEAGFQVAASIGSAIVDTILAQFKEASDKNEKVQTGWIMERQPPNFADAKFESLSRRVIEAASRKKAAVQASDSAVEDLMADLTDVYSKVTGGATQRSSFYKYLDDDDRREELIAFCAARDLSIVVKKFVVVIFFNLGEARFRAAAWSDEYYNTNKSKVHAKVASGYVVYWSLGKFQ